MLIGVSLNDSFCNYHLEMNQSDGNHTDMHFFLNGWNRIKWNIDKTHNFNSSFVHAIGITFDCYALQDVGA